ncbi:hypothetical protein DFP73DRAFT_541722 [Morchella snyderi]|nr:hypothetical protein DFP73DRAFT_541722 [Morchella snyderi]
MHVCRRNQCLLTRAKLTIKHFIFTVRLNSTCAPKLGTDSADTEHPMSMSMHLIIMQSTQRSAYILHVYIMTLPSPNPHNPSQALHYPRISPTISKIMSTSTTPSERRIGQYVRLRPSALEEYKKIHAAVWPDVLKQIRECNIRDYSIFFDDKTYTLFATFKYVGTDYEADMKKMAANEKVREWWDVTDQMQESPIEGAVSSKEGPGWWKATEEVFYMKE